MIAYHCGERVILCNDQKNRHYFRARCRICKRWFKQRKRKPEARRKAPDESV